MDHGALLILELVASPAVLARLASRLAISPIPFYLIAGLALGEGQGTGRANRRGETRRLPQLT